MRKVRSFTLIELLIVVAIIAILAAIAVPNFLEAQMRAKVTRVVADLRSIVIAINSYAVDYNDIPCHSRAIPQDRVDYGFFDVRPRDNNFGILLFPPILTTPIEYLSVVPFDPFNSKTLETWPIFKGHQVSAWYTCVSLGARPFNLYNQTWEIWPGGSFRYTLVSVGPDYEWNTTGPVTGLIYDPSNGTVSRGDIYYYDHIGFAGGYAR